MTGPRKPSEVEQAVPARPARTREAELGAVIIRADGTRVPLGRVDYYHRNPLRRGWWRLFGAPAAKRRIERANRQAAETGDRRNV